MLQLYDYLGNANSVSKASSIDAINTFIHENLHYDDQDDTMLTSSLAADPSCPMLLLLSAYNALGSSLTEAESFLSRIEQKNPREEEWERVMRCLVLEDREGALNQLVTLTSIYTRDILAVNVGILLSLYIDKREVMLDLVGNSLSTNAENSEFLAIASFAYVENKMLEKSEEAGMKSFKIDPHNGWTHHSIHHVFCMRKDYRGALDWLIGKEKHWSKGKFVFCHNTWHKIVCHIIFNEIEEAEKCLLQLLDMDFWTQLGKLEVIGSLVYFDIAEKDIFSYLTEYHIQKLTDQVYGKNKMADILCSWFQHKLLENSAQDILATFSDDIRPFAEAMVLRASGHIQLAQEKVKGNIDNLGHVGASLVRRKTITDYAGKTWRA